MYTSLCALGLIFAPTLAAPSPAWLTNYSAALDEGSKKSRPVAVFVGSGPKGQDALLKEGQFSQETLQILADKYVCVYLDRGQTANERLVRDLGITKAGLVISDRTGSVQAFHHDGTVAQNELTKQLRRFSEANLVVSQTISNTNTRTSYYGGAGSVSSNFTSPSRTVNC